MNIIDFILSMSAFFVALTFHEFSHGYIASLCGDKTAKNLGRLTLNPFAHIDPVGTVIVPVLGFLSGIPIIGWAKPVPVDPRNYNNPNDDEYWVSLAGPASNFILAFISAFLLKYAVNLVAYAFIFKWLLVFMQVNVALMIFNLIPIPPLDGSWMLRSMLPDDLKGIIDSIRPFGFFILMIFLYTGIFDKLFIPAFRFVFKFLIQHVSGLA